MEHRAGESVKSGDWWTTGGSGLCVLVLRESLVRPSFHPVNLPQDGCWVKEQRLRLSRC